MCNYLAAKVIRQNKQNTSEFINMEHNIFRFFSFFVIVYQIIRDLYLKIFSIIQLIYIGNQIILVNAGF